jgi:hypothetical protein
VIIRAQKFVAENSRWLRQTFCAQPPVTYDKLKKLKAILEDCCFAWRVKEYCMNARFGDCRALGSAF